MNRTVLLILVLLLATGAVLFFWQSDTKKIQRRLDHLAEYCSGSGEETAIEALKKAAQAAKLCLDPCRVEIPSHNVDRRFGRKEIIDNIVMLKKSRFKARLSFHDTVVEFPTDETSEVLTTLQLDTRSGEERFTDAYELRIMLSKQDGDWYFSAFTVNEVMEQ